MTIAQVGATEALRDWSHYEAQIMRVVERGDAPHWPDDILTCLQRGTMQLWRTLKDDGIGVTELQDFPRYKQLLVYMVAGENAQEWLHGAHHQLEAFAISHGCTRMEFHGRPGWARWCQALGYEHSRIVMTRRLSNERRHNSDDQKR